MAKECPRIISDPGVHTECAGMISELDLSKKIGNTVSLAGVW